jgi:hypothetical protein
MTDKISEREAVMELARANRLVLPEPYFDELVEAYSHVNTMLMRFRTCQTPPGDMEQVFVPAPASREGTS